MDLKRSRLFRWLTVEDRSPLAYSLPSIPPRGRTVAREDGSIAVEEVRDWYCNPLHVDLFRQCGVAVQPDPHCPLYSRTRRWRWERPR